MIHLFVTFSYLQSGIVAATSTDGKSTAAAQARTMTLANREDPTCEAK